MNPFTHHLTPLTHPCRLAPLVLSLVLAALGTVQADSGRDEAPKPLKRGRAHAPRSFCESGFATALELGAAGAVWTQQWGLPPVEWFDCGDDCKNGFLNRWVTGRQETRTTGAPVIDADLILRLPFAGTITLTANHPFRKLKPSGQIIAEMNGVFVADLNAARAVVTDETITIAFGQSLHSDPDALITVTQTTGKFKHIRPVGDWEWRVSGTITIARVADLPPQTNILAALQNSALILAAEEEVVLSGQYNLGHPLK
jgi:hypothetical protein